MQICNYQCIQISLDKQSNRPSRRQRRDSSTWWGKAWPRSAWALARRVSVASQTWDWDMMSSFLKGPRWLLPSMKDWVRCPEEKITMVTAGESSKEEVSGQTGCHSNNKHKYWEWRLIQVKVHWQLHRCFPLSSHTGGVCAGSPSARLSRIKAAVKPVWTCSENTDPAVRR